MEYRSILDPTHSATKRPTLRTAREVSDGAARPEVVALRGIVEAEIARVEADAELPAEGRTAALASLRRVIDRL
jgi:hypothetical protein